MGEPARNLDSTSAAAERRAAILALPLRPEPLTDEEERIFREIEAEVESGHAGIPHADVPAEIERLRRESAG